MLGNIIKSLYGNQYTIGELMNIDAGRQERANSCQVKLVKTYHELKKESVLDKFRSLFGQPIVRMYYVIFKFEVTSNTGNSHIVIIKVNPDFNLNDWGNNKVKVYCSCPDFKYRSAYLLEKHNSLFINDKTKLALSESMLNAPKSTTKTTLLCKHSFAALNWLIQNYINIMKTI